MRYKETTQVSRRSKNGASWCLYLSTYLSLSRARARALSLLLRYPMRYFVYSVAALGAASWLVVAIITAALVTASEAMLSTPTLSASPAPTRRPPGQLDTDGIAGIAFGLAAMVFILCAACALSYIYRQWRWRIRFNMLYLFGPEQAGDGAL